MKPTRLVGQAQAYGTPSSSIARAGPRALTYLLLGACLGLAYGGAPALSPSSDPSALEETLRRQIQAYVGTNRVTGIPLADRSVNWQCFSNWPNEFLFQGRVYKLRLTQVSLGDVFLPLESRSAVKSGMDLLALYYVKGEGKFGTLSPFSRWRPDGSVDRQGLGWKGSMGLGQSVFMQELSRSNPWSRLTFFEPGSTNYHVQYYLPGGELLGDSCPSAQKFQWQGTNVSAGDFDWFASHYSSAQRVNPTPERAPPAEDKVR